MRLIVWVGIGRVYWSTEGNRQSSLKTIIYVRICGIFLDK